MDTPYVYRISTPVVVDGDTVKTDIDLGFFLTHHVSVRLAGLNAPELSTTEGKNVRAELVAWIASQPTGGWWLARTYKTGEDKYGRYLAAIVYRTAEGVDISMNQWLLDNGYAKVWDGTGQKP